MRQPRSSSRAPIAASFIIGFFLKAFGTKGVFGLIAFSMAVVVISIGGCAATRNRELEKISQ